MASYELDRRGGHYDDLRAGSIAAALANLHCDPRTRREPYGPLDFAPWNEYHDNAAPPIQLDDDEAQSKLIERMMFPQRAGHGEEL